MLVEKTGAPGGVIKKEGYNPMKTNTLLTTILISGLTFGLTACVTTPSPDPTASASDKNDQSKKTKTRTKPKKVKGGFY
ncbi:MAG: hypothetical protein COA85_06340 [Robiginitomaculum sp.]|nr:MAG: hypothetical protein COA85_06340 [Robiginitomaculum sp.]